MAQGSNPGDGKIFRTNLNRPWGQTSLLYRFLFPGVKRQGRGVNHPPQFSEQVKERVELYLNSAAGPLWCCYEANLTLVLRCDNVHNLPSLCWKAKYLITHFIFQTVNTEVSADMQAERNT
jgi:hypothetical protein